MVSNSKSKPTDEGALTVKIKEKLKESFLLREIPVFLILIGTILMIWLYLGWGQYWIYEHFGTSETKELLMEICFTHFIMFLGFVMTIINTMYYFLDSDNSRNIIFFDILLFGFMISILLTFAVKYLDMFSSTSVDVLLKQAECLCNRLTNRSLLLYGLLAFIDYFSIKKYSPAKCEEKKDNQFRSESSIYQFWCIDIVAIAGILFSKFFFMGLDYSTFDILHFNIITQSFQAGMTGMLMISSQLIFIVITLITDWKCFSLPTSKGNAGVAG